MNLHTNAQIDCYKKVAYWLAEMYDNVKLPVPQSLLFSLQLGSATALIDVSAFGEYESIISIWSYVATEVSISDDLLLFLLKQNDKFRFGGFSMVDEGDIRFHVSLLGSSCQQNEFRLALTEVLETADRYDDQIIERWGGRRAADTLFDI